MSPLPSSGLPSGSTMRPSSSSPTGISSRRLVRLTVSPSTILFQSPKSTAPTLSDSRLSARPVTSFGSSSISNDMQFSRPWMRQMPSATESTVPTSVRSALEVSRPSIRLFRIEVISSGLISMNGSLQQRQTGSRPRYLLAKLFESVPDRGIKDEIADSEDDAAEDVRVYDCRKLNLVPGLLADALSNAFHGRFVEWHGARDLDGQQPVHGVPHLLVPSADAEDRGHPVAFDQRLEE